MNSRQLWFWLVLAAGLLGVCWFLQRRPPEPAPGLAKVLPELNAAAVTAVQVRPGGKVSLGIRAARTNHTWQLTEPLGYPAQGARVDKLLASLESLTPAMYIKPAEIRNRRDPDEDFGFVSPQASIILQQETHRMHLLVGALTPPGDQVYVQVVARAGVYVVDAELLKSIPRSANEWRDTTLVSARPGLVDRLAVTNNSRAFILQRETNSLWRMVWPLAWARADSERIEQALQQMAGLRILQFVSDEPKPDLETYGLLKPALEVALTRGSNSLVVLQFGQAAPGTTNEIYARRLGQDSIFTVSSGALSPWRGASVNDFRDPHLLTLTQPVGGIDVNSEEPFSLRAHTNGGWRVLPQNIAADRALVGEWLSALTNIPIVQFTKDVVNPPELPEYGLAKPVRSYGLRALEQGLNGGSSPLDDTNGLIVELYFGLATNAIDRVFVRRPDETSVYSISTNDFARLPGAGWQLQERQLWTATEQDVAGLTIQQAGKTRELLRQGDHSWTLAPGSQGIIEDLAVEQTVRGLLRASARAWVARGTNDLARFGLQQPHQLTVRLKNGTNLEIDFGATASPEAQYAAVRRGAETYVLEFPWHVYRDVGNYLSAR